MFQILLIVIWFEAGNAKSQEQFRFQSVKKDGEDVVSHSCIHDQIIEQRKRPGLKVYSITPQIYKESSTSKPLRRALLEASTSPGQQEYAKQPIRIYLNYDAVGHSLDRDCKDIGDIVKVSVISRWESGTYLSGMKNYNFNLAITNWL